MKSFNLSEWAVTHRPMVLFLIIATLVLGLASFTKLGRLEDPNFEVPTMTAVVAWPGATAQQVQDEVLNRMERELQEIDGVDYIRSFSRQGYGGLTLWMKGGTSKNLLDAAWYQARKKIGDVRGEFPDGVRGPFFNDEFTDVYTVLYALRAPELQWPELQALAEELKRGLQSVPGVNKVDLLGRQAQQVHVEFSSRRLAALGLTPQSLIDALSRQNAMTPAGAVEGSAERTFVRISGPARDVADIEALPIEAGGRLLRLSDVATVRDALEDPPTFTVRHNGEAVLALGVTVSRSSVEWWPERGATTSTVGWDFMVSRALGSSVKRLKRSSRQKGLVIGTCSCTATSMPLTSTPRMPNSGFSYSLASRWARSKPADTRCAIGVWLNGDSGWL
jgi:multidrug efflux pump subunit AcrB